MGGGWGESRNQQAVRGRNVDEESMEENMEAFDMFDMTTRNPSISESSRLPLEHSVSRYCPHILYDTSLADMHGVYRGYRITLQNSQQRAYLEGAVA